MREAALRTDTMNNHHTSIPIAVVGMACRTPGADNLDEYWQMIRDGRSAIAKVPNERLNRDLYYSPERGQPGRSYTELGGVISDRPIDLAACGLKPEMTQTHDPAHLTICDVAASALRHARMDPLNLPQRNVGVYIGHAGGSAWAGDMVCSIGIEETANYLLTRRKRDMASLYALLDRLDLESLKAQRRLTIPFVKTVLVV